MRTSLHLWLWKHQAQLVKPFECTAGSALASNLDVLELCLSFLTTQRDLHRCAACPVLLDGSPDPALRYHQQ